MAGRDEREEDEEDDRLRREEESSEEDEEQEAGGAPKNARDRKKAALMPAIASLCSALGGYEESLEGGFTVTEYKAGDQVVGCLKDLKRFWRLDENDDDRTVARIFYEVGLVKNDLVPLLANTLEKGGPKNDRIALACAELIGAMTWPINIAEELRDANTLGQLKMIDYKSLIDAQMSYKAIILRNDVLLKFVKLMEPSLVKIRRDRSEKDDNVLTLILNIFRNLAAIKDRPEKSSQSAQGMEQATLQSEYIQQLSSLSIFDVLIAIASDPIEYAPWNTLTLEIFYLIFRCVKPTELITPFQFQPEGSSKLNDLLEAEKRASRGLARKQSTRHSRFGTTISIQSGDRKYIAHRQSATIGEGAATKVLNDIKKSKHRKARLNDDLAPPSSLRPAAILCLYNVAIAFLDAAFNPFFSTVLKDIRMERLKIKETDTIRFLVLSRFFLEFFLLVYRDEAARGISSTSEQGHDFDLIAEMTEPSTIGFVANRMKQALEDKPPQWIDLHAGIDCYTQILLVIDALAASGVEDNIDVAEILQNKLYYEGEMLDIVVSVVAKYSNQSLRYLESVITLAHVLQRMLEKYSKSKAYMYIRKKKSKASRRKKKKKADNGEDDEGDGIGQGEDEEEEMERRTLSYAEHAFEFSAFELKFAEEPILETYIMYLEDWKSLDCDQLRKVTSLMHRQAVKGKSEGLFFKPSVLELFAKINEDPEIRQAKPRLREHIELKSLIEYITRKLMKASTENPALFLDIFYPKSRAKLSKMRLGGDAYSSGEDARQEAANGEVEVAPGFSLSHKIGIAIGCLFDTEKEYLVDAVKGQLVIASAARTEVVLSVDGIPAEQPLGAETDAALRLKAARTKGPSKAAIELLSSHTVEYEHPRERKAAGLNEHFKMLMRLLSWSETPQEDSFEITWVIPATILPSTLDADIRLIEKYILEPLDTSNGKMEDLLQAKRKIAVRKPSRRRGGGGESTNEEGGESGLESDGFPPTTKGRRVLKKGRSSKGKRASRGNGDDDDDTNGSKKRAKKRAAEAEAYKSAQFVADSDDEDNAERDAVFFAAEQALRDQLANGTVSTQKAAGKQSTSKRAVAKRKKGGKASDDEADLSEEDDDGATAKRQQSKKRKKGQLPAPLPARRSMSVDSIDEEAEQGRKEEAEARLRAADSDERTDEDIEPSGSKDASGSDSDQDDGALQRMRRAVSDSSDE